MKAEGITYDEPTGRERSRLEEERKAKKKTAMEYAFKEAVSKCEQGFKIEKPEEKRKPKAVSFNAT
jgi:phosphopantetheinyl transferase (holo-ACP synthase)